MATVFELTDAHPLILDLLARRNWFEPRQLEEFEELIGKAGPGNFARGGPDQGRLHLRPGDRQPLRRGPLPPPDRPATIEAGEIDKELASLLPEKLCTDKLICPMALRDDVLDVAFVSPEEMGVVDELQLLTGLRINPLIAPLSVVEARLDALYRADQQSKAIGEGTGDFDSIEEEHHDEDENILNLDAPPPPDANGRIVRMVNQILEQALRNGASDIHLEPFEDGCKFRLRIDGVLHELPPPSKAVFIMIISRFKILAKMDIAEKRDPPGRRHRAADRRQADRPPRQHGADRLRREDGHANPRQGGHPART